MRERGLGKIIPASDLFGAAAAYNEHRTELLELVNIFQWLTIMQASLALFAKDKCWLVIRNNDENEFLSSNEIALLLNLHSKCLYTPKLCYYNHWIRVSSYV